jgi:hypothetical protein
MRSLTSEQLDQLERRTRATAPAGVVAVGADELAELVNTYRLFHATLELMTRADQRCKSCGFERCKHTQSPCCAGFEES